MNRLINFKVKTYYIRKALLLLVFCASFCFSVSAQKREVRGVVVDRSNHQPLVGVTIYLPELKVGTVTDSLGTFSIKGIGLRQVLLQASYIGYRGVVQNISVADGASVELQMEHWATEINEIVVTGVSKATEQKRSPAPILIVSPKTLKELSYSNIIDALSTLPGVSQITTGAGISKPVIRGMGYNRVLVVNDGVRQEEQQWGDEHGVEIDGYSVDRVEILKGPASLAYGSDALAGVINMLPEPFPVSGELRGSVKSEYQTNNGLWGGSVNVAGNTGAFVWSLRTSGKMAHDYQNKYDDYVFNSRFKESSINTVLGLNKPWGYSHLTLEAYGLKPGIVEGERDAATGSFVRQINNGGVVESQIVPASDHQSYRMEIPYQKINHYKMVSSSLFNVGEGTVNTIFGLQQNLRRELGDALNPSTSGLYLKLNTLSYDVKYSISRIKNISLATGLNGMGQSSYNLGSEVLIPEYKLFDIGAFVVVSKSMGNLDLSGGVRVDRRNVNSNELIESGEVRFPHFRSSFTGVSGSIGATYQISSSAFVKANLSRGYRAPNIAELGSNGVHEGTLRYEIGDHNLKAEHSLQVDLGFGWSSEHISANISLFNSKIDSYVYLKKLSSSAGVDSLINGVHAFKYTAGDANLTGGEVQVDLHPHPYDWIHFENTFSYVRGRLFNQPDSSKNLPAIPAARLLSSLRLDGRKLGSSLANGFFKFDVDVTFKQSKVFWAYNTETPSSGYVLLNAAIGADLMVKRNTVASVMVGVNNIADKAYQSHLSRLKYAPENEVTGRTGVYNMGRNFIVKVTIPFDGKL